MSIKIEEVESDLEGCRILRVEGEVDMDSAPTLRDRILKDLQGASVLKVDLSKVDYLDSSGIAVLIQGFKQAQRSNVEFRLLNPSSQVKAVIDLAQLNQLFTIEETGS